jgi:hypothetical protein
LFEFDQTFYKSKTHYPQKKLSDFNITTDPIKSINGGVELTSREFAPTTMNNTDPLTQEDFYCNPTVAVLCTRSLKELSRAKSKFTIRFHDPTHFTFDPSMGIVHRDLLGSFSLPEYKGVIDGFNGVDQRKSSPRWFAVQPSSLVGWTRGSNKGVEGVAEFLERAEDNNPLFDTRKQRGLSIVCSWIPHFDQTKREKNIHLFIVSRETDNFQLASFEIDDLANWIPFISIHVGRACSLTVD